MRAHLSARQRPFPELPHRPPSPAASHSSPPPLHPLSSPSPLPHSLPAVLEQERASPSNPTQCSDTATGTAYSLLLLQDRAENSETLGHSGGSCTPTATISSCTPAPSTLLLCTTTTTLARSHPHPSRSSSSNSRPVSSATVHPPFAVVSRRLGRHPAALRSLARVRPFPVTGVKV